MRIQAGWNFRNGQYWRCGPFAISVSKLVRQCFELSVITFAPFDVAAQFFVTDTLDALIADILAPEFHDAFDLAQHMDGCAPLRLLPFTQRHIFINHAIDAATCKWKSRLLSKLD